METLQCNAGSHDLNVVTPENLKKYLPNLRDDLDDKLKVPGKADIVRVQLLKKYGGLWLDADIILFSEPSSFTDKIKEYEFAVAGHVSPDNWLLLSRKEGEIVSIWAEQQEKLLNDKDRHFFHENYFSLGRELMRPLIEGREVFRFPKECAGRDSRGLEISMHKMLTPGNEDPKCKGRRVLMHLRNTAPGIPSWLHRQSRETIISSDTLMGSMFREALGHEPKAKGLGDMVKKVTDKMGIKQCRGCGERQRKLNRLFPFNKKGMNKT